jgi:hypothetical protein
MEPPMGVCMSNNRDSIKNIQEEEGKFGKEILKNV